MKGNDTTTTLRKKQVIESLYPMSGAKRVGIFHEASAGETGIDLSNLNMPSTYSGKGYSNPSSTDISLLRINFFRNNLKIISTDRGILTIDMFTIASNTLINFDTFTANANEIFEIWFEPSVITGTSIVDASPLVKTYLLPEGTTDVTIEPYEINKFPLEQIGAVMVFRGPIMNLQLRNSGNATASILADGNYEEVKASSGLSNIIRFNIPAAVGGENITIISIGSLTERPTESMIGFLENLNGDLEVIRNTLSALSGQPKSNFNGQPHSIDLASFGERFNAILNTEIKTYVAESEVNFTPTGSWGNVTYTGKRYRSGQHMYIRYRLDCVGVPTPATTTLGFNMVSGFSVDTSKLTYAHSLLHGSCVSTGINAIVDCEFSVGVFYPRCIRRLSTNTHDTAALNSTNGTDPTPFVAGNFVNMMVRVPIVGWLDYETKTLKEMAGL